MWDLVGTQIVGFLRHGHIYDRHWFDIDMCLFGKHQDQPYPCCVFTGHLVGF